MPITVADFSNLTIDLQEIFNEVAARSVSDNVGFQVFDVFDTERRGYIHQVLHGLSGVRRVTPGSDLPKITTKQGDSITWTQDYFGAEVSVTKEMRKFDLYNQMEQLVTSITQDAFDKVDQSLADVLLYGWSTSYTDVYGDSVSSVCPDGLALFSAVHSNPLTTRTYSNIITDGTNTNPPLSRQALVKMRTVGLTYKDPNGLVRPIVFDTLIVSPANWDLANRLINSDYLPGGNQNDVNPLKGSFKVLQWPRTTADSAGTDKSAYWFLFDSRGVKETLNCLFAERPSLDAPHEVYDNKNWDYSIDYFYAIGRGFPAYIAGSKGDNS